MEDKYEEAKIPGAKEPEPLDSSEHKEKGYCICKISGKEGKIGTGFFCKIKYENELVPVLITNYHVIDDNYIGLNNSLKVYINEKSKFINLSKNKILYSSSNNKYDIIIIRLLDNEIEHYLKIDENIFENSEKEYKDEPIYILHYPGKDEKAKVSYSEKGIEKINEYDIKHYCNTEEGSSGSPILSSMTNKIIGIHKAANRKRGYNFGSFLKYPLSELKGNKNEIICIYNKQEDEIKLLYDYTGNIYSDDDYELKKSYIEAKNKINGNYIDIYINDKKIKFNYKYKSNEKGNIQVKFVFNILLTSTHYMFHRCSSLESIDLSSFDTTKVNDMGIMFNCCSSLKSINLSSFNTTHVKNMYCMFTGCSSLESLDLSSFNTTNVEDMAFMFSGCSSLKSLNLSSFDTTNVKDMWGMFSQCSSLQSINVSSFNTTHVNNMSMMFNRCSSLKLIDLSSFNTTNVKDMSWMFQYCHSLQSINLSSFDTTNVKYIWSMLNGCYSLRKEKVKINNYGKKILDKICWE